ncbi:MAG: hypothetical protein NUW08_03795 [Candidatus Uhrbacteria bacterium]|nr:hypothetical protein [Candidatus Uhrbacteria bacterium]
MDIQERLALMTKAATIGGNQALVKRGRSPIVADTGGGGLTTAEDEAVQTTVMRILHEGDPDVNIIGEEAVDKHMTEQVYVIDPIDGSVSYSRDGHEWGCTVAFKNGDDIEAGVIYQPRTDTLTTAMRGGRVSIVERGEEQEIPRVSDGPVNLSKLVAIAPLSSEFSDDVLLDVFVPLLRSMRFTVMSGSNTDGIKRLILGHVDVFIGWGSLWDFAVGKLCVEMLGGAGATFHGDPIDVNVIAPQRVVLTKSRALLDAVLPLTRAWPIDREKRTRR